MNNASDDHIDVDVDALMTTEIPPPSQRNKSSRRSSVVSYMTTSRRSSVFCDVLPADSPDRIPTPFKTSSNSAFTSSASAPCHITTSARAKRHDERNELSWKGEEREMRNLLKQAFRQAGVDTKYHGKLHSTNKNWSVLKGHAMELKRSFMDSSEFFKWWDDDLESCHQQIPVESFNVMNSYCMQRRIISHYTHVLTVSVPSGTLGISLASDNDGTVIREVRESSVLVNKVCPGDRILSIDGEDVHQKDETEVSTMLALWQNERDRKLGIKPSLASTTPFLASNCSQICSNYETLLIYNGIRTYITTHRMSYNEVRVLLQQSASVLSKRVDCGLIEIDEDIFWSHAKILIAHWFISNFDCNCQTSDDVPAARSVKPPALADVGGEASSTRRPM